MTRVAVTGARGFIGRHLIERLAARGDQVSPIVVRADVDEGAVRAALKRVEVVVNLAGVIASVREADFVDGNVEATRLVARAAAGTGARLVHVSSLAAAGPAPASAPRNEDDPPAPITIYGRTKLEGERVIASTPDLQWTILRPGVVYGPGDRALLPLFRMAARGVLPLVGPASAAYTFVHIEDMVRTIVGAVERPLDRETVFVGHSEPVFARDLLEHIRSLVRPSAWIVPVPRPLAYLAALLGEAAGAITGRPAVINRRRYAELAADGFVCRVDRLRERLGLVACRDFAAGVVETADWYKRSHWI